MIEKIVTATILCKKNLPDIFFSADYDQREMTQLRRIGSAVSFIDGGTNQAQTLLRPYIPLLYVDSSILFVVPVDVPSVGRFSIKVEATSLDILTLNSTLYIKHGISEGVRGS